MKKVILLKAGENRATTMPVHTGTGAGQYTFAVAGLDMSFPTTWSVIGARNSEVAKDDTTKIGTNKCIVHIPSDQGEEGRTSRVINVSVIGTDDATKQHVETKSTLTLTDSAQADQTDFSFYTHVPAIVSYTEEGEVLAPVKVEIKAHLDEAVTTVDGVKNFTATCVFDIEGETRAEVLPMTLMAGSDKVFHVDVTNKIKAAAADMDDAASFLEATYTVEIHKHHLVADRESYFQVQGGKFIIDRVEVAV